MWLALFLVSKKKKNQNQNNNKLKKKIWVFKKITKNQNIEHIVQKVHLGTRLTKPKTVWTIFYYTYQTSIYFEFEREISLATCLKYNFVRTTKEFSFIIFTKKIEFERDFY